MKGGNQMATTRRTEAELLQREDEKIAKARERKAQLRKRQTIKEKSAINNEYFRSKAQKERTRRLIQKGALAETYFEQQNGSIDEFENLLKQMVKKPDVIVLIELNKPKKTDNITDVSKIDDNTDITVNQSEKYNNTINMSDIQKIENDILAEINKKLEN